MSSEGESEPASFGAGERTSLRRRLTIVFITITFDPEPGAQHGLPLARWLQSRGHTVKVITALPQYPLGRIYDGYELHWRQWETIDGVRILRVPIYPSHDSSGARRMLTYLSFMLSACLIGVPSVGRADVVFLYEPPPTNGAAALLMKWFRGAPYVQHIADLWPETVLQSGMLRGRIMHALVGRTIGDFCKYLYKNARFVSVHSPSEEVMLHDRGVPADKTSVTYNWVDETIFRPMPRDEALAGRLGMASRFNFLFAGNLGPMQRCEVLVQAAALLTHVPEIQLVIVGTGPLAAQVRSLAAELGATNVRFIGRQPHTRMPAVNALGDVHLVHLRNYDFLRAIIPSKTQVAMASGRPTLIAANGDAADLVKQAGAGVVCAPDDPRALADAMLRMYRMPRAELEAYGERARRYYVSHLSLDASAAVFENLLIEAARE
ncbi:MAG TPA: glycosyltransferase family 4 protein [Gemmatimonadaceae bacterium]|nr:glycosyltransferase family 4 protein [Gemmatimonadaceae bacterium]